MDKLKIENTIATEITYKERKETPLWDHVALREAVINAIVHNDWASEVPPVFEIYSDRIEITSAGGLSAIKNKEDFFTGFTKPINRELMRIFKDVELVEHLGSGMGRILPAYGRESFQITENFMRLVFYKAVEGATQKENKGVTEGVTGPEEILLKLITQKPGFRAPFYAAELDTSVKNIERWIAALRKKQLIKFKGAPKTGGYFLE